MNTFGYSLFCFNFIMEICIWIENIISYMDREKDAL